MIYVIGSLKNKEIPHVAEWLRSFGHEVFDDWYSAGPDADDYWQKHCQYRDISYAEALNGAHAECVFEFDLKYLTQADTVVLVLPAGKSGHMELGWALGQGKRGFVLFDGEPERYDIMYRFATGVAFSLDELKGML